MYPVGILPKGMSQKTRRLATGIELFYLEMVPEDAPGGRTVLFVHGFPELSITWCAQMEALAAKGYRCIAPDMRGYGFTTAPKQQSAYHMMHLCADLCALLDLLGVQKTVIIGHDWGGFVAWSFILHHEDRVLAGGSLNTPLSSWEKMRPAWEAKGRKGPMDLCLQDIPSEECGQLDYQAYFNIPDVPERELEADVERTINAFFRSQLPSRSREEHKANMEIGMRTAKCRKDNNRGCLFYAPSKIPRDPLWPAAELDAFVSAFSRKGFFGPLGWYRNIDNNIQWSLDANCAAYTDHCKTVTVPCLMVTAEYDVVLNPAASQGMERHFLDLTRGHVHCGHWIQHEARPELHRILLDWLSKKAPNPPSPRM